MRKIKTTYYGLKDFANIKIPKWQRWTNQKNVKSLEQAVKEQGQLRPILICILPDKTKILTDGKHLYNAMLNICSSKFNVIEVYVKDEEEARNTFISFNTKGKTLSSLDYVVSYAGGKLNSYNKFLKDVLQSPKDEKDAKDVHSKLFTIPALIRIFLGAPNIVRSGKSNLHNDYDRILEIVEYLGENYLTNGVLVQQMKRNGKSMRLNGGSIIPVMDKIKSNSKIKNMKNKEILYLLIDYTQYHYNSTSSCTFTKDAVSLTFSTFLQEKGL